MGHLSGAIKEAHEAARIRHWVLVGVVYHEIKLIHEEIQRVHAGNLLVLDQARKTAKRLEPGWILDSTTDARLLRLRDTVQLYNELGKSNYNGQALE